MIRYLPLVLVLIAATARADDAAPSKADLAANRIACEHAGPSCNPVLLLTKLERREVDRFLEAHPELALDRAPAGKTITKIRVSNHDVFGPDTGFLRWFNFLHVTTKEQAVLNELTLGVGDAWNQLRLDESARRLRDPVSTAVVAIVPLVSGEGQVELLVVTRDVWSLRANSVWEIQENKVTYLSVSLSENNLLGRRKLLALTFRMNQGEFFTGPVYIDKNIAGKQLDLRFRAGPIFNRGTSALEGSESVLELARPLYSVDTKWGAGVAWSHRFAIDRSFLGPNLRTYDAPSTPEDDLLPYAYRIRKMTLGTSVVRAFGDDRWQQRLRIGHELSSQRPALLDDFPMDENLRMDFADDVFPRSERVSMVYVGGELFEPRYRNIHNNQTMELAEETRMGLFGELKLGAGLKAIGSNNTFFRVTGDLGYAGALGDDGLWVVKAAGTTRLQSGQEFEELFGLSAIDTTTEAIFRVIGPSFGDIGRVASQVKLSALFNDTQNQFYTLGGDSGLRGYPIGFFTGDRRLIWSTELRTRPVPILFTRWGLVAFYEVGGAANSYRAMDVNHDIGLGVRVLTPQINTDLFRFDAAFPISAGEYGFYGPPLHGWRLSAGYDQTF